MSKPILVVMALIATLLALCAIAWVILAPVSRSVLEGLATTGAGAAALFSHADDLPC